MRHGRKTVKLQRRQDHRDSLLSNLVVSLIAEKQIKTTLAKAKAVRPFAEKMVTLAKRGDLHARRTALGYLRNNKTAIKELFDKIGPASATRAGGYTRITKLGQRMTDSAPMAFIEWVDITRPVVERKASAAAETETPAEEAPAAEAPAAEAPAAEAAPKKAKKKAAKSEE